MTQDNIIGDPAPQPQATEGTAEAAPTSSLPFEDGPPVDSAATVRMLIDEGGPGAYLYHLRQALTAWEYGGESPDEKSEASDEHAS